MYNFTSKNCFAQTASTYPLYLFYSWDSSAGLCFTGSQIHLYAAGFQFFDACFVFG